jgi:antitoxin component YwqK of YwqJK toxin-antitoxin module
VVAQLAVDAALADAAPPPRLACEPNTKVRIASSPDPTWFCARADGTRHGPFITVFPDDTIEVSGSYRDGVLDGPWLRRHVDGAVVEEGRYAAGHKDGRWKQTSPSGTTLGEYELAAGTGVERFWYDGGALYSERALEASVPHGSHRVLAADGAVIIAARYTKGQLDGPHTVGVAGSLLRFDETFAAGVRRGARKILLYGTLIADETYDRQGRLDGAYTLWRRARVMRAKGQFSRGRRIGAWTWWDRNNNKEKEGRYVEGRRNGPWTEWLEGKLLFSGAYSAGKPDGEFVYFDRLGRELGRFTITAGTGTMLTFHTNKKAASRQAIVNGVMSGIYQELTPLGKIVVQGRYRADHKHGTWKYSTMTGAPLREHTYELGRLDGVVRKYIDGRVAMETTYADGKVVGPYAEYRDGKPAITGQYDADRKHGTWTTLSSEGLVVLTATYDHGVLQGPWRQLVDGTVVEGEMRDGRRSGTWTVTDRSGAVTQLTYTTP